ncbi:MAG: hypothetical protein MJ163_01435 [Alphaproteobacteria bacterium]|nr:hypothetical protein [Alphaproteobacteria bacterium]
MFEKKEDAFYKNYYLFGKRVWRKQKSAKEMVIFIMKEMEDHCADMQSTLRKNTKKILKYVDEHYEAKKVAIKKHKK